MEKYVVKNEYGEFTAVLVSPEYGGGYSTWGHGDPMDGTVIKELLEMSEDFDPEDVDEETEIDVSDFVPEFRDILTIQFVAVGKPFQIQEQDGSEIIVRNPKIYIA